MAKRCKAERCHNIVFNNKYGYCRKHLYLSEEYRKKVIEQRSNQKVYKIPPTTDKRFDELKQYSKLIKEIDKEAKLNKGWYCFFCGEPLGDKVHHHHLKGREGIDLVDKAYIVLAHSKCHMDYHDKPVNKLRWFKDYIERLKLIDPALADKEIRKYEK